MSDTNDKIERFKALDAELDALHEAFIGPETTQERETRLAFDLIVRDLRLDSPEGSFRVNRDDL